MHWQAESIGNDAHGCRRISVLRSTRIGWQLDQNISCPRGDSQSRLTKALSQPLTRLNVHSIGPTVDQTVRLPSIYGEKEEIQENGKSGVSQTS